MTTMLDLVLEHFQGDVVKMFEWFDTPNPMLGDVKPKRMIELGQTDKLLKFIRTSLLENGRKK